MQNGNTFRGHNKLSTGDTVVVKGLEGDEGKR
jgi:hypothetical protein